MKLITDRVSLHPGRVKLTNVSGETYDLERADEPTQPGTKISADVLNAIYGFDNKKTVFNEDGSITVSDENTGSSVNTVFNPDGTITETFTDGNFSLKKTTTFNNDGSITEELEWLGQN